MEGPTSDSLGTRLASLKFQRGFAATQHVGSCPDTSLTLFEENR